ncbi:RluA family pseudouridine synthase [Candidatus Falkowbacteria bacterium]|nr:RluA family pseudouridine synthase [Candidatus Falkowbacteria bacterium]
MEYIIESSYAGERLDKYLNAILPDRSRNQIQKSIKSGKITVNGKNVTPHHFLQEGDQVVINEKEEETHVAEEPKAVKKKITIPEVPVIAETDDYIVINKPSGLLVHDDGTKLEPTVAAWLLKHAPEAATVGDDPENRPGIVHRLDKDVSGLMVVAKNQKFYDHVKKQFQKRTTLKKYSALVHGKIAREQVIINFVIERAASGHKMAARPTNQEGKTAESEVTTVKKFINYTLVKVRIKTGRTHQIRAHLAAYGNPIVGDNLYGTNIAKIHNKKLGTERIYLVSDELSFKDLDGNKQVFTIELPEAFEKMLQIIK